jgi:hypothetical protein
MSDSNSSFVLTPPPAPASRSSSRIAASVVTVKRRGVTVAVRHPDSVLILALIDRVLDSGLSGASVQTSTEHRAGGGPIEHEAPGTLFEDAPQRDDGLVSAFLADRTESAHQFWEPLGRLSSAYLAWSSDRGIEPLSHYAFSQQLRNLKFRQGRTRRIKCGSPVCPKCARSEKGGHQTRTWEGLRLRQSAGGPALVVPVPSEAPRVQ